MLLMQFARRAASLADCTAGKRRPTRTPIIAITTSSSTSVKPFFFIMTSLISWVIVAKIKNLLKKL
jgi:hypothetical protein